MVVTNYGFRHKRTASNVKEQLSLMATMSSIQHHLRTQKSRSREDQLKLSQRGENTQRPSLCY